jgi:hypothetical protein
MDRKEKGWHSWWLYLHGLVYACFVFAASGRWDKAYWIIPVLYISHVLIDRWKSSQGEGLQGFVFDQAAHGLVLMAIWLAFCPSAFPWLKNLVTRAILSERILLISAGYLLMLWPSGYAIGKLTEPFRRQIGDKDRGLENAGLWIGCLERLFVYTFMLIGAAQGIAVLAGAKSIFRFGEIKDPERRKETEYILIGSLLSYGFAMVIGLGVKHLSTCG